MTLGEIFEQELAVFQREHKGDAAFLRYVWTESLLTLNQRDLAAEQRVFIKDLQHIKKAGRLASDLIKELQRADALVRDHSGDHKGLPPDILDKIPHVESVKAWAELMEKGFSGGIRNRRPISTDGRLFTVCALMPYFDMKGIHMKSDGRDGRWSWLTRWYQNFGHLRVKDCVGVEAAARRGGLTGDDLDRDSLVAAGRVFDETFDLANWWKGAKESRERWEGMCLAASSYIRWTRRLFSASEGERRREQARPLNEPEQIFARHAARFLKKQAGITRDYIENETLALIGGPVGVDGRRHRR